MRTPKVFTRGRSHLRNFYIRVPSHVTNFSQWRYYTCDKPEAGLLDATDSSMRLCCRTLVKRTSLSGAPSRLGQRLPQQGDVMELRVE